MTRWWHFQGMFSSTESGVCPNSSRNCLDAFFLRLEISPRLITTSCSYVLPSIWMEPKEKLSNCIGASLENVVGRQALFFEVMAENADQRCSTSWLSQCGQTTPPS